MKENSKGDRRDSNWRSPCVVTTDLPYAHEQWRNKKFIPIVVRVHSLATPCWSGRGPNLMLHTKLTARSNKNVHYNPSTQFLWVCCIKLTKRNINVWFFKYGPIPASFSFIFVLFLLHFQKYNWKKRRWCALDSNTGSQNGRHRRNHGAMADALTSMFVCKLNNLP